MIRRLGFTLLLLAGCADAPPPPAVVGSVPPPPPSAARLTSALASAPKRAVSSLFFDLHKASSHPLLLRARYAGSERRCDD